MATGWSRPLLSLACPAIAAFLSPCFTFHVLPDSSRLFLMLQPHFHGLQALSLNYFPSLSLYQPYLAFPLKLANRLFHVCTLLNLCTRCSLLLECSSSSQHPSTLLSCPPRILYWPRLLFFIPTPQLTCDVLSCASPLRLDLVSLLHGPIAFLTHLWLFLTVSFSCLFSGPWR